MDVSVNLAVDEQADFEATLARARRRGLKVSAKYDTLKVASGKIDEARLAKLMQLKGVKSVEPDREVAGGRWSGTDL